MAVQQQMMYQQTDLSDRKAISVVTDTEATMIAAGCHFVERSLQEDGKMKWLGCIDHLLQLVIKISLF